MSLTPNGVRLSSKWPGESPMNAASNNEQNVAQTPPGEAWNDPPRPERQPRLSEELAFLIGEFKGGPVRLSEVIAVLHGRAWIMLLLLLSLPFCTPIPLPGFSTPFGFVIALVGFRLALRRKPWLPDWLFHRPLPAQFFPRLLAAARRVVKLLEFFLRPRLTWLLDVGVLHHLYGAMILAAGLFLLLPLPVPLSNTLPALTVVLLAGAMLERDGWAVLAGTAMFLVTLIFFATLAFGGAGALHWLTHGMGDLFPADPDPAP